MMMMIVFLYDEDNRLVGYEVFFIWDGRYETG